jgi:hypothetical protein
LVFILWAAAMFHMLWRLTKRSRERLAQTGGGYFKWVGHNLTVFADFFTSEEDRPARNRLFILTGLLFAIILARALLLPLLG